jgi:hypothetical protein
MIMKDREMRNIHQQVDVQNKKKRLHQQYDAAPLYCFNLFLSYNHFNKFGPNSIF